MSLVAIDTSISGVLRNACKGGWQVAREHMLSVTGGRCRFFSASVEEPSAYTGASFRLGRTWFHYFCYDWMGECRTRTERAADQHAVIYIPLRGGFTAQQNGRSRRVAAGSLLIVSTPGEIVRRWSGPFELVNLVVPLPALHRLLVTEYGADAEQGIGFDPMAVVDADKVPTLRSFVVSILEDARSASPIFADRIAAGALEGTLQHILLRSLPHSHAGQVKEPRSVMAPYYVRRAESHLMAHLTEDVTIEELARVAGVSPRTIYYGFKRYRRMTPMKFLKRERLAGARKDLMDAARGPRTVSEIALQYGYTNASQFSRDYKSLFGESAQATLRRAGVLAG